LWIEGAVMKKTFEQVAVASLPGVVRITAVPISVIQNSSKKVLVVDEDRKVADTLVRILELNGFHAEAVYDGEKGLARAREMRPDILISDVGLPGMDGITLADSICALRPNTQVILICERLPHTNDLLTWSVLKKPIRASDLLTLVSVRTETGN
jgi:DNA-binding response OmpR family regulator